MRGVCPRAICPRCGKSIAIRGRRAWKSEYHQEPVVMLHRHIDATLEGVRRPCSGGGGTFVVEALRFDQEVAVEVYP